MESKNILFLLVTLNVILARPESDYNDYDYTAQEEECEDFFINGKAVERYNLQTQAEYFNYTCVEQDRCGLIDFGPGIWNPGISITDFIVAANSAICKNGILKCCPGRLVLPPAPESICSDQPGYSCVKNSKCKGNLKDDEKMSARCFNPEDSVEKTCCSAENIIKDDIRECSSIKEHRCVREGDCKATNLTKKRKLSFNIMESEAEEAICSMESNICCHEANILHNCSEYSQDGYQCSKKCFDLPQDEPREGERNSTISYYRPKFAKCQNPNHTCCRRREELTTVCCDGTKVTDPLKCKTNCSNEQNCENWGDGYECMALDKCDPNTIAVKQEDRKSIENDVFEDILFANKTQLFTQIVGNGIAIDSNLIPCNLPQLFCCKAAQVLSKPDPTKGDSTNPDTFRLEAVSEPDIWPIIECGVHNEYGISKNDVKQRIRGISSQEGEWPHACIMFHKGQLIGGASLIAPKVLVTAAHIIEHGNRKLASDLVIRCGEYDLSTNNTVEAFPHQEKDVEDFTIHPFYTGSNKKQDGSFGNDIAIIHTKTSFQQAPNVNTICLPTPNLPYSESICSSMGWGTNTLNNTNSRQDIMKQVKLNRITNTKCEEAIKRSDKVSNTWTLQKNMLCANLAFEINDGNVLCKGDGGGPLVCQELGTDRNVLAGIVNFGFECGRIDIPEVFSSIQSALCFINFDVKCKHGKEIIEHIDFDRQCSSWVENLNKEYNNLTENSNVKPFWNNFENLQESCIKNNIPKDISSKSKKDLDNQMNQKDEIDHDNKKNKNDENEKRLDLMSRESIHKEQTSQSVENTNSSDTKTHGSIGNIDPCECTNEYKSERWICVKPFCKDSVKNPNGTCEDTRRCRKPHKIVKE